MIDDETIRTDSETIEDIRIITNNTGKSNLRQKSEELKRFVVAGKLPDGKMSHEERQERAHGNLRWLLQYLLSRRLNALSLHPIYVDIIRELNYSLGSRHRVSVIGLTLMQAGGIFKKCMLIDEDEFHGQTKVAHGTGSVIKKYLQDLGTFLGSLTLAQNEPIRSCYLNLKQILFEGAAVKNSRLAVAFVCRILKESVHSQVFTPHNPWVKSLLGLLREVYDIQHSVQDVQVTMEIETLVRGLGLLRVHDIQPIGLLNDIYHNVPKILQERQHLLAMKRMIMPPNGADVQ
jgi:hypothetical protein